MPTYNGKTGSVKTSFSELTTTSSGHPNTFNPIYRQLMDNDAELQKRITDHAVATDPHPQYATDADLSNHTNAADPHPQYLLESELKDTNAVRDLRLNLIAVAIEVETMKAADIAGTTGNFGTDVFTTLDGITLKHGAHDAVNGKIYLP